jgi:hypothetical protein
VQNPRHVLGWLHCKRAVDILGRRVLARCAELGGHLRSTHSDIHSANIQSVHHLQHVAL